MNAQEQEELDLAVAISLSEQDSKPCRQSDAFLTSIVLPNRNRNERLTIDRSTNASNLQQLPRSSGDSAPLNESYSDSRGALYNDGRSGRSAPMAESPSSSSASYNHRQNRTPTGKESQPSRASSVLNFGLPSRLARQLYKEISPSFNSQLICPTCNKGIFGAYVNVMDGHYHPECFRCSACNGQLVGSHFSKGDPPLPYHQECAEEIFGERCCVCDAILRGQYLRHPFFQEEIYCLGHQGIRQCCACNRKEPIRSSRGTTHRAKEGFTELHDGRVSCMDCISTAIIDSAEALPLYLEAVDFMERVLGLLIPKGMREVPILAVDLPSLNEQQKNNNTGFHLAEAESTTRGLTLSSIGQVQHLYL